MSSPSPFACDPTTTLPIWLSKRAALHPERSAISILDGDGEISVTLTYGELLGAAQRVAMEIRRQIAIEDDPGAAPRLLLLYPTGVDFITAYLGTQLAGCVPVPTCFPKPHREMPRLNAAAADCQPQAILTDTKTQPTLAEDKLDPSAQGIPIIATDALTQSAAEDFQPHASAGDPEAIAFLQYTSGSTSEPKGVIVRHRNLIANLESIRQGFDIGWPSHDVDVPPECGVFWLPLYHDMGLIGGVLEPLYSGGHSILMSPGAFLQRPLRWLDAISKFGAIISGAPNFAYQLCIDRISPEQTDELTLQNWRLAFCGAEPIAPRTLRDFAGRFASNGFRQDAFYPCYGLAEATLLVAGGVGASEPKVVALSRTALESGKVEILTGERAAVSKRHKHELVGCGPPVHGTEIRIVEPESRKPLGDEQIGEIWVGGDGVAAGYFGISGDQPDRFEASLSTGEGGFLRTGDLGFMHDGQLFVTGRVKDMIILRGRNLFPQDLEATVARCVSRSQHEWSGGRNGAVSSCLAAAFSVSGARSEALAVVVELPRGFDDAKLPRLSRRIRREVIEVHDVDPKHIWLVRAGAIPVTTSGKVRRTHCRKMWTDQSLRTKHRYDRSSFSEQAPIAFPRLPEEPASTDQAMVSSAIEDWMRSWLIARAGVEPTDLCREKPLSDYGLDSMTAVELSGETEDWSGVALTPEVAWDHPTIAKLSEYIAVNYIASRI